MQLERLSKELDEGAFLDKAKSFIKKDAGASKFSGNHADTEQIKKEDSGAFEYMSKDIGISGPWKAINFENAKDVKSFLNLIINQAKLEYNKIKKNDSVLTPEKPDNQSSQTEDSIETNFLDVLLEADRYGREDSISNLNAHVHNISASNLYEFLYADPAGIFKLVDEKTLQEYKSSFESLAAAKFYTYAQKAAFSGSDKFKTNPIDAWKKGLSKYISSSGIDVSNLSDSVTGFALFCSALNKKVHDLATTLSQNLSSPSNVTDAKLSAMCKSFGADFSSRLKTSLPKEAIFSDNTNLDSTPSKDHNNYQVSSRNDTGSTEEENRKEQTRDSWNSLKKEFDLNKMNRQFREIWDLFESLKDNQSLIESNEDAPDKLLKAKFILSKIEEMKKQDPNITNEQIYDKFLKNNKEYKKQWLEFKTPKEEKPKRETNELLVKDWELISKLVDNSKVKEKLINLLSNGDDHVKDPPILPEHLTYLRKSFLVYELIGKKGVNSNGQKLSTEEQKNKLIKMVDDKNSKSTKAAWFRYRKINKNIFNGKEKSKNASTNRPQTISNDNQPKPESDTDRVLQNQFKPEQSETVDWSKIEKVADPEKLKRALSILKNFTSLSKEELDKLRKTFFYKTAKSIKDAQLDLTGVKIDNKNAVENTIKNILEDPKERTANEWKKFLQTRETKDEQEETL